MIREDIKAFVKTIPESVALVAATKYGNAQDLMDLCSAGIRHFGENRVEDFLIKRKELSDFPIKWHFIGHLQRNKVKKVIQQIDVLESLDSIELAKLINKERTEPLECFIEVSINGEVNKNGVSPSELENFINEVSSYKNIHVTGLMMMAVKDSDDQSLHQQFKSLRELRDAVEKATKIHLPNLSMGMSDDYLIAIEEGATHVRLGRILFIK